MQVMGNCARSEYTSRLHHHVVVSPDLIREGIDCVSAMP